jgi:RNA polymerase sigma-70 factor (ECF subfamily)
MDKNEHHQHPVDGPSSNGTPSTGPQSGEPAPLLAQDLSGQDRIDYELMQRVAINNETAVGELYDRFGSLVFRMAYQSMPTRSEAEDAVQEIFVRLWRTADRYDPRKAALVTWVMLLTRRHLVDKLRRKRARIKTAVLDDSLASGVGAWIETNAGERLVNDEQFAALVRKIETLPDLQQTVVLRAYLGGQTLRQISEDLNTPLGTIKSALSRALVRLRERTGEEIE